MKHLIVCLFVIPILIACSSEDECNYGKNSSNLITPKLYVNLAIDNPMTGILTVYPCNANSSIYFGNYNKDGELVVINATYLVKDGYATNGQPSVRLPIGNYNMVYWGIPIATTPQFDFPATREPPITLGADLAALKYELFKYPSDTTYYPTYDYALGTGVVNIGSEQLTAALKRKTAAIDVIVKNKDNSAFNANIDSMWIYVGGISQAINFYTGDPDYSSVRTVKIPLVSTESNTKRISKTAMTFPSVSSPLFQLFIELNNGQIKTYKQNLSSALTAGTHLTLTLTLNEILSEENEIGEFTVNNWTETSEGFDIPPLF